MVHYWERFGGGKRLPPGEDLAAMRRGAGHDPGSMPGMWRLYSVADQGGREPGAGLVAEHVALVLFGIHQQGARDALAHQRGQPLGRALHQLRHRPRYRDREGSLDARVAAAATASTVGELAWHLRTLVRLLRDEGIGLDYTSLWWDLLCWQEPGGPEQVRRALGRSYFAWGGDQQVADGTDGTDKETIDA